jgi:tetratricopeptide (TPR) repeat protein
VDPGGAGAQEPPDDAENLFDVRKGPAWHRLVRLTRTSFSEENAGLSAYAAERPRTPDSRVPPRPPPAAIGGSPVGVIEAYAANGTMPANLAPATGRDRAPGRAIPRQLPIHIPNFVGRADELDELTRLAGDAGGEPQTIVVFAVAGAAGIGKTALAIHWAYRVRYQFPDGDLYANLRGYGPGTPAKPTEALTDFLRALDVPAAKIPASLDGQSALFRTLLDGRRILIVLDNAATASQVRPLLPGSTGSVVVVTSRSRLAGLVARDGARRLQLGLLSRAESVALLRKIVGSDRIDREPAAAERLASQCAYLPLALRVAGERAASAGGDSLADLADSLADERHRLDELSVADDDPTEVRAAFRWSYRALKAEDARTFRLLGLHPGPELSTAAVMALTGADERDIRARLDALVSVHLVEQSMRGRFRLHDLLRCYAAELAADSEESPDAAARLLAWYLHTADAANRMLSPQRRTIPVGTLPDKCVPLAFHDHGEALRWCDTERSNLVAATALALDLGRAEIAWRLPVVLWSFYKLRRHWTDWITTHELGIAGARLAGDSLGEAWVRNSLGSAFCELQRYEEAIDCWTEALRIRREIGDRYGEGTSLNNLSAAYRGMQLFERAAECSLMALDIHRAIHDRWNEGIDLTSLGVAYLGMRRYEAAIQCWDQALAIQRDIGDRFGESVSLHSLGEAHHSAGEVERATVCYEAALRIRADIGDRYGEGRTMTNLARVLRETGEQERAQEYLRIAQQIFVDLGHDEDLRICRDLLGS